MNDLGKEKRTDEFLKIQPVQKNLPEILKKSAHSLTATFASFKDHLPAGQVYTKVFFFVSSMSIRYKIAGALIVVLALAIASLGFVTFSRQKNLLQQEMKNRAAVLVQHLANVGKEGLLTKQELVVFSTIKDIQKNPGVVYALVTDAQGQVFAHNILTEQGKVLNGEVDRNSLKADSLLFQNTVYRGEPIIDASLPVVYKGKNIRIGTARIGLSEKELREAIAEQKLAFFWIFLAFVTIGLSISFALARILTQPIYTLALGMQVVAGGDLSQQVKVFYKDEIGKLTESFNQMILSLREKLHMEKYLSYSALKSIKRSRDTERLKLGGEQKYVTALFSDVRGFTSMSEKMSPEEVVELLNIYLNLQAKIVHHRGGVVDKFVGDEVMAIFEGKGNEANAVRAAIEIQCFCQALNWSRARSGKKQMQVGVGINSGQVIMGNMGSEDQMNHTVIGDNINIAARLCSAAKPGQVVISKIVADAVGKEAKLRKMEPVTVKGKEKPLEIYEVSTVTGVLRKYMRRGIEMEASYNLQDLPDEVHPAVAKNIGAGGCLLEVPVPIGIGSRLDLKIESHPVKVLKQVRSVVRHIKKQESKYYVGIGFEELSEDARSQIIEWVHQVESEITHDTL